MSLGRPETLKIVDCGAIGLERRCCQKAEDGEHGLDVFGEGRVLVEPCEAFKWAVAWLEQNRLHWGRRHATTLLTAVLLLVMESQKFCRY